VEAFRLALLGATDKEISVVMGVSINTIDLWKRTKSEFLRALMDGKTKADAKVAASFYLNCIDRWVEEEQVHVNTRTGKIIKVKVRKFVQGDKWAQQKWLSIRQRSTWADIQKTELVQKNININKFDFSGLSTDELALVRKLQLKELAEHVGSN
jgi:hypothetical protein